MTVAIGVDRLVKSYGDVRAADDVSFSVAEGEAVALMGPNGSGKTTVLRCVAGLLRPDGGRVAIAGVEAALDPLGARARLAFLPQQPAFAPSLTPLETLRFHARLRGLPPGRAAEALGEVGLDGAAGKPAAA
ncbi:MAG: ABC transporter ATP-binding protein, partial [Planctomycetes bacterium]|nr:ABC transporter ATP-binding protein [Planctomycetota bacterium]